MLTETPNMLFHRCTCAVALFLVLTIFISPVVQSQEPKLMWVTASNVNVRTCPDVSCSIVGSLDQGKEIEVVEEESGFARIRPHAKEPEGPQWISIAYISANMVPSHMPTNASTGVKFSSMSSEEKISLIVRLALPFVPGFLVGWWVFPITRSVFQNLAESPLQYFLGKVGFATATGYLTSYFWNI